ncbi:hypothetical protein QJQ45_028477 [Haematococcus lacustris]|nr:hypothetical protein QJQ45_028477 [Haematococcus lacustris]
MWRPETCFACVRRNTLLLHVCCIPRSAIEKLRAQNEQLKHDLLLENKFSVRPGDPFAQALINNLQDEGDNLARKIVLEMRKSKMLDQQMDAATTVLTTTRNLMGGINCAKEQNISVQKRIKLLENRLEKAYVKYNQSITHNKQLREQINNLRRERLMFESIHNNLERELVKLKKDMADTIQLANQVCSQLYNSTLALNLEHSLQSNTLIVNHYKTVFLPVWSSNRMSMQAMHVSAMLGPGAQVYELKEKATAEMAVLMGQAEKEQAGFEEEWRQLTQIIEDNKRERVRNQRAAAVAAAALILACCVAVVGAVMFCCAQLLLWVLRGQERARAQELAMRERETQELLKSGLAGSGRAGGSKHGISSLGRTTMLGPTYNKALAQNVAAEKVQMYGQAFEKIQAATGIEDIDVLVSSFISAEDQNYTLFNYVNEVNTEIEALEDQINIIRREVDKYRQGGAALDRLKSSAMKDTEERLASTQAQAELYEKRYEAASNTVAVLKTSIFDLFDTIGCNTPAVRELLGDDGLVTEGNVLAHLGIIEQRTNELLQAYAVRRAGDSSHSNPLPPPSIIAEALMAQPLTSASPRIIIEPPSTTGPSPEEVEALELAASGAAEGGTAGLGDGAPPGGPEDERPLTREALESRVAKTLARKLDTAIKWSYTATRGARKAQAQHDPSGGPSGWDSTGATQGAQAGASGMRSAAPDLPLRTSLPAPGLQGTPQVSREEASELIGGVGGRSVSPARRLQAAHHRELQVLGASAQQHAAGRAAAEQAVQFMTAGQAGGRESRHPQSLRPPTPYTTTVIAAQAPAPLGASSSSSGDERHPSQPAPLPSHASRHAAGLSLGPVVTPLRSPSAPSTPPRPASSRSSQAGQVDPGAAGGSTGASAAVGVGEEAGVPAVVTSYQMAYHLGQWHPRLYASMRASTRAHPTSNTSMKSEYGDMRKAGDDSEWRSRFFRSMYTAVNNQVWPHTDRQLQATAAKQEAAFFRWMARQQTYYRELLQADARPELDALFTGMDSAQRREALEVLRQLTAVTKPDMYKSHSQAVHGPLSKTEDPSLTALMREQTRIRTMGHPPPQIDGTYPTLAGKQQQQQQQGPGRGTAARGQASGLQGVGPEASPYAARPGTSNGSVTSVRAVAGGRPRLAEPQGESVGRGGQGAGREAAAEEADGGPPRPVSATAVMESGGGWKAPAGPRLAGPPVAVSSNTFKSSVPLNWAVAANLSPCSTYQGAYGSLGAGAGPPRRISSAGKFGPQRKLKFREVSCPMGAVNPVTALAPARNAYPVPECYVRTKPFNQPSDGVMLQSTHALTFAPREEADVLRAWNANVRNASAVRASLTRPTLPLGAHTGINLAGSKQWQSDYDANFTRHNIDVRGNYEQAKGTRKVLNGPTASTGRATVSFPS